MSLYIIINVLVLTLYFYSKLASHKAQWTGKYHFVFLFFEKLFEPILNLLRKIVKPEKVGNGIALDMSQIILLIVLLII